MNYNFVFQHQVVLCFGFHSCWLHVSELYLNFCFWVRFRIPFMATPFFKNLILSVCLWFNYVFVKVLDPILVARLAFIIFCNCFLLLSLEFISLILLISIFVKWYFTCLDLCDGISNVLWLINKMFLDLRYGIPFYWTCLLLF